MVTSTQQHYNLLVADGAVNKQNEDQVPIVKFFLPNSNIAWLVTKIDPVNLNKAYGLWDYGVGEVDEGYFDFQDLFLFENFQGECVRQDEHFIGRYPLSIYRKASTVNGCIVDSHELLERAYLKTPNSLTPN